MALEVTAVYNPRRPNGDVSSVGCDSCGKIGAAYIKIDHPYDFLGCKLICKGCLSDWDKMINQCILQDVHDSVRRRREKNV